MVVGIGVFVIFVSFDDVICWFDEQNYLLDIGMVLVIYLVVMLGRLLLLEGEFGVGKIIVVKIFVVVLDIMLIWL